MGISLRVVAVGICVLLTALTAALTLTVSFTFTQRAVDDIGGRYTRLMMSNLVGDVQGYLQKIVNDYFGIATQALLFNATLPFDSYPVQWNYNLWNTVPRANLDANAHWVKSMANLQLSSNFTREYFAAMCFADGSAVVAQLSSAGVRTTSTYCFIAGLGGAPGSFTRTGAWNYTYNTSNNGFLRLTLQLWGQDCRTRPYYTGLPPPAVPRQCYWTQPFMTTTPSAVVGLYCTMFNQSNVFLGLTGATLELSTITQFVAKIGGTANSNAFVTDEVGYLLASTHTKAIQNSTRFIPPLRYAVGPNCLIGTVGGFERTVCRQSVASYGYAPLIALNDTIGVRPPDSPMTGTLLVGSDSYYFAMSGVKTYTGDDTNKTNPVVGLAWTVVILVPQDDIIGQILEGQTFSIISAACVFVVASVVCFGLFTIFLSPLSALEEQMMLAADMELDEEDPPRSALTEVGNMQDAFVTLKNELRRVKQFLPQTLLAREDADEGDGVVTMTDTHTARSTVRGSTRSSQSRQSRNSRGHVGGKGAAVASAIGTTSSGGGSEGSRLNLDAAVFKKKLTVVAFNLQGFNGLAAGSVNESQLLQQRALTVFKQHVTENKGVVDSFHGDRFFATFNAVTNNPQHALRASGTVESVVEALRAQKLALSAGIATGDAHVGNMGIDGMRRFCIIGAVYSQATVLERLGKSHTTKSAALFSSMTVREANFDFYFQGVDVIQLPGRRNATVVYVLESRRRAADSEWMYVLESGEKADRFAALNDAYEIFAKGDGPSARAAATKLADGATEHTTYGRAKLEQMLSIGLEATIAKPGPFYTSSYGFKS